MRLKLVIKDFEYLDSFVSMVGKSNLDVVMEIGNNFEIKDRKLILTDYDRDEVDENIRNKFKESIIYLTDYFDENDESYTVFKYCDISTILSRLRWYYFLLTGEGRLKRHKARFISIFCDGDSIANSTFSESLARQIVYRTGESIMMIPLCSIVRDNLNYSAQRNALIKKFLYAIETNKEIPVDAFSVEDGYGVTHLQIGSGINPLIELNRDEMDMMIDYIAMSGFQNIILDIGSNFTIQNIEYIRQSSNTVFLKQTTEDQISSNNFINVLRCENEDAISIIAYEGKYERLSLEADNYSVKIVGVEESQI